MQAQGGQARLPAFKKFNPESRLEFSSLLTGPYPEPNPKFQSAIQRGHPDLPQIPICPERVKPDQT